MKIIDRYISKNFIKSFILSLIAFTGIFIVSQLFRVVRYVTEGKMTVNESVVYIGTLLPRIFIDVAPLAVLLGSMMTVSQMASNLEIISLKTSGISFKRIVISPIIISFFISIIVFFVNDSLYPKSQIRSKELKRGIVLEKEAPLTKENAFLRGENGNYVYLMQEINRSTGFGKNVEVIDLNDDFTKVIRIITAKDARYNFSKKIWVFKDAEISYSDKKNMPKKVAIFSEQKYNDDPNSFITLNIDPKLLTTKELKKSIRETTSIGGETKELLVELGNRYSFPFASFIISFLGLALGGRYVRGTSAVSLGICVVLGYSYYILKATFEVFMTNGILNPLVGGWIPNILFLIVGIYLLQKAEY